MLVYSSKEVNRLHHLPIDRSIFFLPSELLVSSIASKFPCRHEIIRSLVTLLSINANKNIVLYGLNATGKSLITKTVLERLSINEGGIRGAPKLHHTIIKTAECITSRHLMEKIVKAVADALGYRASNRCENASQLVNELEKMFHWSQCQNPEVAHRLVLVFDGIDQQVVHSQTLPALAKLGELVCICAPYL